MDTKKRLRNRGKKEVQEDTAVETKEAVERIKQAVADSKQDISDEEAGTKEPHVAHGWAAK